MPIEPRRRGRWARRLTRTALAAALLALSACGGGEPASAPAAAPPPADAAPAAPAAPAPGEASVDQLLKDARLAVAEDRLATPAGNNAIEFYLDVVAREPNNAQAMQALVDIFPLVAGIAERLIAQRNLDEAERVLGLLDRASPNSFTVGSLRARLDSARGAQQREQQAQLAAQQAAQRAAREAAAAQPASAAPASATETADVAAAAAPAVPPPAVATPAPATATPPPAVTTAAPAPAPAASTTAPPPVTPAPIAAAPARPVTAPAPEPLAPTAPRAAPIGESRDPRAVRQVSPEYPPEALRRRQEGWVELEFTIGADGRVRDVSVVRAQPPRVFDREAVRAMQQWTFEPALRNGQAVDTRVRRRIEFRQ